MTTTTWKIGDVIAGPYLVARNSATSGIHSDEFARSQGFERAVVAGPNHLTFVSTLLEEQLGARWREQGRLRARFTAPVYDGEQVRAVLTVRGAGEGFSAEYILEKADATVVATGSAAWTPMEEERRERASSPPEELLDLRALTPSERVPAESVVARWEAVERFCRQNHDPLVQPDRVPTSYLSPLLFHYVRVWLTERGVGPGMWGEIDIRQHRALRPDVDYRYEGTVLSLRRRGALEVIDLELVAREEGGALACAITHAHLIPHRDRGG